MNERWDVSGFVVQVTMAAEGQSDFNTDSLRPRAAGSGASSIERSWRGHRERNSQGFEIDWQYFITGQR